MKQFSLINYRYWQSVNSKLPRFTVGSQLAKIAMSRPMDETKPGFLYPSIVDAQLRRQGGYVVIGAEGLRIQQEVGSIEVGKLADLLILNKNPLEDIHNSRRIWYVMKEGILCDTSTMHEVWLLTIKCPEWRLK